VDRDAASRRLAPVLVADVHALGMLAVLRSLGRAGYVTHGYSSNPQALGLHSRYNRQPVQGRRDAPNSPTGCIATDYLRDRALIPPGAAHCAPHPYQEFQLAATAPRAAVVYCCLSKCDVLASFAGARTAPPCS
jgi:hypothetical protein